MAGSHAHSTHAAAIAADLVAEAERTGGEEQGEDLHASSFVARQSSSHGDSADGRQDPVRARPRGVSFLDAPDLVLTRAGVGYRFTGS